MSGWSDRAKDTSKRLNDNTGADIVLIHMTEGAYNPATRTKTMTPVPYPGIKATVTERMEEDASGRLVKSDRRVVIIPAANVPAGVEITKSDRIQLGADSFAILDLGIHAPAGTVVEYKAEIAA